MSFAAVRSCCIQVGLSVAVFCILWNAVGCCENATDATGPLGVFRHSTLNSCITDIVRAICSALKPRTNIKRNTELINSILGLPRVLQDAGR